MKAREYPNVGDFVVCSVKNVTDVGAFVTLDEYENKEGFIHISEVASGWVKYIRDYVREGRKVVCKVLNVSKSRGHVDLSLKQVNEHQRKEKIQSWKNEQKAENLLQITARKMGNESLYIGWKAQLLNIFDSLYEALEACTLDEKILVKSGLKGDWVDRIVSVAKESIIPLQVTIKGVFEITCFKSDGIVHIREALKKCEELDSGIKIQHIGAPKYRIEIKSLDYKNAEAKLKKAINVVTNSLKPHGGTVLFKRA